MTRLICLTDVTGNLASMLARQVVIVSWLKLAMKLTPKATASFKLIIWTVNHAFFFKQRRNVAVFVTSCLTNS